jgi:DNA-binding LacI/PurR family transcriptional regulator
MVRLKDIASRMRLSVSTVSAILNTRDPRYNGVTRTRVMKVAKTLGYRTNRHAQMLRHGRTGFVGVVHPDLSTQVSTIAKNHLIRELRQKGWYPLEYNARWFENDLKMGLRATFDHLLEARIEGLVLVRPSSWVPRCEIARIRNAGIPMVSQHGISVPGSPQIRADVRGAMRDLTWHMVRLGHRHLLLLTRGFCADPASVVDRPILDRIQGFQEAITQAQEQGRSVRGEVVQEPLASPPSNSSAMGQRAMEEILRRPRRPDAVLCTNDFWALGAMRACSQAGLRVPHDMALAGFDNEFFGQFLPSALTTVQQPDREEARCTVEMLSRLIRGERLPRGERNVILPCELVIRESCGAHVSAGISTSSDPVVRGGNGGNHAMDNLDLPDFVTPLKE